MNQQTETVHAVPPDGSGLTKCCGRTPFELPRTDRMTENPADVTCRAAIRAAVLLEAADRLAELRAAEREWLPATGLHKGEQELRRMADATNGRPGDEPDTPERTG